MRWCNFGAFTSLKWSLMTASKASWVLRKIIFAPGNADGVDSRWFKIGVVRLWNSVWLPRRNCVHIVTLGRQPTGGIYEMAELRNPRFYKDFLNQGNRWSDAEISKTEMENSTEIIREHFVAIRESLGRTSGVGLTVRSLPWLIYGTRSYFGIVFLGPGFHCQRKIPRRWRFSWLRCHSPPVLLLELQQSPQMAANIQ
jgi:hypothetical protein